MSQKVKRGISKRFKVTKKGRIKRRSAGRSHILTKMKASTKMRLRVQGDAVSDHDRAGILSSLLQKTRCRRPSKRVDHNQEQTDV